MHIAITGAAGMIGRKLAERIAATGGMDGTPVHELTLIDVVAPAVAENFEGTCTALAADLSAQGTAERLIASRPDVIVHLAAVVSGEAEADFDKGYLTNLDGTRALFDAIRAVDGYTPRLIYASSLAVFGPPSLPRSGMTFI